MFSDKDSHSGYKDVEGSIYVDLPRIRKWVLILMSPIFFFCLAFLQMEKKKKKEERNRAFALHCLCKYISRNVSFRELIPARSFLLLFALV